MTTLHGYWLVRSLGWTLLHFCWQGVVIAIVLWCALQLLRSRPAQARYLAACVALALMILMPLLTLAQIGLHEYRLAMQIAGSTAPADATLAVESGLGGAPWLASIAATLEPLLPWVLAAWTAGLCVSFVRLTVGLRLAFRLTVTAVSPASAHLQAMFSSLQVRLGVQGRIALLTSALVQVPTVVGWLRPVVLLPLSCFTGLEDVQIEAILCHELAHIRRHDYFVSIVQSVVEALLFYHPAVWWVSQQVRRERECCCDDLAVTIGGNAMAYAKALSALETRRSSYPEVVLGSNGGVLTMRIKRLLQCEEISAVPQIAAVAVLTILTLAAAAIAGTARAQVAAPASSAPTITVAATAPLKSDAPMRPQALVRMVRPVPAVVAVSPAPASSAPTASPVPDQAIRIAGGVAAGQILSKVSPIYPADAKQACIQGSVIMRAVISKIGDVEQLQVLSGPPELRTSALDAVRQWKYAPYLLNGEPVDVETTVTINYNIEASSRCPAAHNDVPDLSGSEPRKIGGSVSSPTLLTAPPPAYTAEAKADKISGSVLVNLRVDVQGFPTHVHVVRGLGHGLDEKAVEAIGRYRFTPAMENGNPVVVALNIEVHFEVF